MVNTDTHAWSLRGQLLNSVGLSDRKTNIAFLESASASLCEGLATPPAAVKTLRELIYWQYAKIISNSAGMGKKQWRFVMDRFEKLRDENIFWNSIREYVKERETPNKCAFCGCSDQLSLEHLFPRALHGPDDEKNVTWICRRCNSSKGARRPYEYWTLRDGLKAAKYEMPRLVEGKYLKFVFETLSGTDYLDLPMSEIERQVCPNCGLTTLCKKEQTAHKLSPLCIDGITTLQLSKA